MALWFVGWNSSRLSRGYERRPGNNPPYAAAKALSLVRMADSARWHKRSRRRFSFSQALHGLPEDGRLSPAHNDIATDADSVLWRHVCHMTLKDLIGSVRTMMAERIKTSGPREWKQPTPSDTFIRYPVARYVPVDADALNRASQCYIDPPLSWGGNPVLICPFCLGWDQSKTDSIHALRDHIQLQHFPRQHKCVICGDSWLGALPVKDNEACLGCQAVRR